MRWESEIKNDGYKWWFAFLPVCIADGPRRKWYWLEWYEYKFMGEYYAVRFCDTPQEERE